MLIILVDLLDFWQRILLLQTLLLAWNLNLVFAIYLQRRLTCIRISLWRLFDRQLDSSLVLNDRIANYLGVIHKYISVLTSSIARNIFSICVKSFRS